MYGAYAHPLHQIVMSQSFNSGPTIEEVNMEEEVIIADGDFMLGLDDDVDIVDDGSKQDAETNRFDMLVGALENVLMDPEFEDARSQFCRTNCVHFEDTDENKLIYMDLFQKHTLIIEKYIDLKLRISVESFDMQEFMYLLDSRKEELISDVFDLLLSLGDFEAFKEVMLSYKNELNGGIQGFDIQCRGMKIYDQEQEDGDSRPDLDFGLQVAPVSRC